jgi:hypothetical protein
MQDSPQSVTKAMVGTHLERREFAMAAPYPT